MPILTPEQICERLRAIRGYRVCDCKVDEPINPDGPEAADRIEQQQATIERLSAALEESYSALRHVYEHGVKPRPQWVGEVFNKAYERARADLGKDAGDE